MVVLEANTDPVPFTGKGGWTGTLHAAPTGNATGDETLPRILARPDDGGTPLLVPAELIVRRGDGTYFLPLERADAQTSTYALQDAAVIPLLEETLVVEKRMVETGRVRITKTVQETEEVVREPLLRESVTVERVPINRIVDAPEAPRQEKDVLIIPLYEETLVVEKRLILKEELRVTIAQTVETTAQTVTLRREEARIDHLPVPQQDGETTAP